MKRALVLAGVILLALVLVGCARVDATQIGDYVSKDGA